ncbi:MAG: hypothetical protein WD336_11225 [Trueperaceae bacterium]
MSDADRIRALRDQGKLDERQAQRLLDALGEFESIDPPGAAADATPSNPHVAGEGVPHDTEADPTEADPGFDAKATSERPDRAISAAVDRWLTVDLLAADATFDADPTARTPRLHDDDGQLVVEEDGDGWAVRPASRREGSWLDRLIDGVTQRNRFTVTLPPRTGVRLDVKAGDLDVRDVPAVAGTLLAGDVEVRGATAIDLDVRAGDVDLELDPAPGLHRIFLTVGDLDLRLPEDADAEVHGRVSIGDACGDDPLRATREGVGGSVRGTLGSGRARIELGLKTGDLSVKVG